MSMRNELHVVLVGKGPVKSDLKKMEVVECSTLRTRRGFFADASLDVLLAVHRIDSTKRMNIAPPEQLALSSQHRLPLPLIELRKP